MNKIVTLALLLSLSLASRISSVEGRPLSEEEVFFRCYTRLTRKFLPLDHLSLIQIQKHQIKANDACENLLLKVTFDEKGRLKNPDAENLSTLETFYDFTRLWFPSDDFLLSIFAPFNGDLFDSTVPALYVLRALFQPNSPYRNIVTGTAALKALRSHGSQNFTRFVPDKPVDASQFIDSRKNFFHPKMVESGQITGVADLAPDEAAATLDVRYLPGPDGQGALDDKFLRVDYNHHFGGGLLGSASYLQLNFGRYRWEQMDGAILMPRRLSKAIFSDLLCRDLPVVRESDVGSWVEPNSQVAPFRTKSSCMQCHSSIDAMAGVYRNLELRSTSNDFNPRSLSSVHISRAEDGPLLTAPDFFPPGLGMSDPKFAVRQPRGLLFFRNLEGQLIRQKVVGIQELGERISELDDLYVCAAKRFFNFFTGIDVPLVDTSNPERPMKISDDSRPYFNFVRNLGVQLKKDQSLKNLIVRIFKSPFFHSSVYEQE